MLRDCVIVVIELVSETDAGCAIAQPIYTRIVDWSGVHRLRLLHTLHKYVTCV